MKTRTLARLGIICVVAALLAACGAGPVLPFALPFQQPTSTSTPTASPVPPTRTPGAAGLCSNPLVPVKPGARWTYEASSAAAAGPSRFSTAITSVRPAGFTLAINMGDNLTANQDWTCNAEGLVALSLGTGQSLLDLNLQGVKVDLAASNPTGVMLPANVKPGTQWLYGLSLAGTLTQGSLTAQATGSVSTSLRAVGSETITVPAGTFNAVKIQGTSTFNITADFDGLSLPVTSVIGSTFWFAPGVGLIRFEASGTFAGIPYSATSQLQSYDVP